MNENSETAELPLTDSNCRSAYLLRIGVQDTGAGRLRDRDTGRKYETMMQIREPFKVAGHGPGSHKCPQEWATETGSVSGRRAQVNQAD